MLLLEVLKVSQEQKVLESKTPSANPAAHSQGYLVTIVKYVIAYLHVNIFFFLKKKKILQIILLDT